MSDTALTGAEVVDALEQLAQYGVPAEGLAHVFDVGTTDFLHYFEREIFEDLVARGGATCKIFEGAYGSGKTHLLQLLEDSALRRGMAVVRTDLSRAMSLENWQLIAMHVLQNIELQTETGVVRSLPRVLDALTHSGRADRDALARSVLPHSGFARAMALMCAPGQLRQDAKQLLARFLLGDKVSVAALKADGILGVKHPLSARNAELVLKTVLAGIHKLGVPGTLLLFDENENTFTFNRSRPPRKVVIGANLLRRLIDASANGSLVATAVVFAVLNDFIDNCAYAYSALGQRLHRDRRAATVGWRSPVLPLDCVTTEPDPHRFLTALVDRIETVLQEHSIRVNGTRQEMLDAGRDALRKQAGSGYRREVVKRIATVTYHGIC